MDNIEAIVPEVRAMLQKLARKFGLGEREDVMAPAVIEEALERAFHRSRRQGASKQKGLPFRDELSRMILCREYLKVLCGKTLLDEIRRAVEQSVSDAKDGERYSLTEYRKVQKMLSPKEGDEDPGGYFDPLAWKVQRIAAPNADRLLVRLALFVEGMLDQEQGLREADASIQEAAERAVYERRATDGSRKASRESSPPVERTAEEGQPDDVVVRPPRRGPKPPGPRLPRLNERPRRLHD